MRIYGIALRGTHGGMVRIKELVDSPDIEFHHEEKFSKSDWETRASEIDEYDGILSQCFTHIPEPFRQKTVLFALGSTNRKLLNKPSIRDYFISNPTRELWVNNNTVRKAIHEKLGLDPLVMYRANDVYIPDVCPPAPKDRFILWYASPWNGCLQEHKSLAKEVIEALKPAGIKVFMAPHDTGWSCNQSHAIALGKVDIASVLPLVHGMVRFGILGDFGRINYDVVGQGKWTLNYDVDEPWMESVSPDSSVDDIVSQIVDLVDNDPEENRVDRWMYAKKYFSTKGMSNKWRSELKRAFNYEQ